jgi:hypothetical protein
LSNDKIADLSQIFKPETDKDRKDLENVLIYRDSKDVYSELKKIFNQFYTDGKTNPFISYMKEEFNMDESKVHYVKLLPNQATNFKQNINIKKINYLSSKISEKVYTKNINNGGKQIFSGINPNYFIGVLDENKKYTKFIAINKFSDISQLPKNIDKLYKGTKFICLENYEFTQKGVKCSIEKNEIVEVNGMSSDKNLEFKSLFKKIDGRIFISADTINEKFKKININCLGKVFNNKK